MVAETTWLKRPSMPQAGHVMIGRAHLNLKHLAALLLPCCPAILSGQVDRKLAELLSSPCLDHLPPSAFKRVVVYAYVDPQDSVSASFAQSADNFLQELVNKTQHQFGISGDRLPYGEPDVNWRGVDVPLHLVAYKDGRIVVLHRDSISVVATAAARVARALDSTSTVGQLEWSQDSTRDSVRFDIAFVRPLFDSAGNVAMPTHKRAAVPVFSVLAPWEQHAETKSGQAPPTYPAGTRLQGYEGTVILSFLVDSTGHAVVSTVSDVWPREKPRWTAHDSSAYRSFLKETMQAIGRFEFVPARIGGCPVREFVQMPFVYGLR